jgi:hypothetical protein
VLNGIKNKLSADAQVILVTGAQPSKDHSPRNIGA